MAWQQAARERREQKKARVAELAAERALKKLQRDAATAEKCRNRANTSKREALHSCTKNTIKRFYVVRAASQVDAAPKAPPLSTKKMRIRLI